MCDFLHYADLAEKGVLPIGGGALDNCSWFMDAYAYLANERSRLKSLLGI